jgi:tetratricopeptide (TPR) repeat protein
MRNPFSRFSKRARANRANARARDFDRQGLTAEAISEYSRACGLDPSWSVPFYNLGLVYKYARQWELSLSQNQRATELDVRDVAARWNLGIAATALGRWDVARTAWRGAGVSLPDGEGPVDYPCGRSPIRLNPEANGEVVWADREHRSDAGRPHRIAIATPRIDQARALLDDWMPRSGGATITTFEVAVLAAPA